MNGARGRGVSPEGRGSAPDARVFYGWWIVAAGFVTQAVTAGIGTYSFSLFQLPVAEEFGVPLPAAALQFPLGNDIVTSVIPGPRGKSELEQILDWFETTVPADFWAALKSKGLIDEAAPIPVS